MKSILIERLISVQASHTGTRFNGLTEHLPTKNVLLQIFSPMSSQIWEMTNPVTRRCLVLQNKILIGHLRNDLLYWFFQSCQKRGREMLSQISLSFTLSHIIVSPSHFLCSVPTVIPLSLSFSHTQSYSQRTFTWSIHPSIVGL